MAAGMIPRSQELPRLPEWNLSATHSDLHEQFIQTKVMLDTYEVFLSDLVSEYKTKASARKAGAVERASGDVRTAYSQFVAIGACYMQKSKDADRKKDVKDSLEAAQKTHTAIQAAANLVIEKLEADTGSGAAGSGVGVAGGRPLKPIRELEPSLQATFRLSGAELERWSSEMDIWGTASGFHKCEVNVQAAFAFKFFDQEMMEKVREVAEVGGVALDFKAVIEGVKALCQSQTYLFTRRVDFFLMKNKDKTARGYIEYMNKLLKEYKAAEIEVMAADAKTYSVYKVLSELPSDLRNRVVQTVQREMTFEDLKAELEKVASLKTMQEAVDKEKPKVNKLSGFDPAAFGCLRCGQKTNPPHEARSCPTPKAGLVCSYCGMQESHVADVCFKKLVAEGKMAPKRPEAGGKSQSQAGGAQSPAGGAQSPAGGRSQSPAGGPGWRPPTPGLPLIN